MNQRSPPPLYLVQMHALLRPPIGLSESRGKGIHLFLRPSGVDILNIEELIIVIMVAAAGRDSHHRCCCRLMEHGRVC